MKTKNIPPEIKSKSINETKLEIQEILERLEKKDNTNLEGSTNDYKRLLILNDHIERPMAKIGAYIIFLFYHCSSQKYLSILQINRVISDIDKAYKVLHL